MPKLTSYYRVGCWVSLFSFGVSRCCRSMCPPLRVPALAEGLVTATVLTRVRRGMPAVCEEDDVPARRGTGPQIVETKLLLPCTSSVPAASFLTALYLCILDQPLISDHSVQ